MANMKFKKLKKGYCMINQKKSFLFYLLIVFIFTINVEAKSKLPNKLRVCSDPNNLPFSHKDKSGFENKIAELIAKDLKLELEYIWSPQKVGFIRNTLKTWVEEKGRYKCDLIISVPEKLSITSNTKPYYRSTYAFIFKENAKLKGIKTPQDLIDLDEEKKANLKIAVFSRTAAVDWLMKYNLFYEAKTTTIKARAEDSKVNHQDRLKMLLNNKFDVVFVWGPIAGHFSKIHPKDNLKVIPLASEDFIKFDYAISMGMRKDNKKWKKIIQNSIDKNKEQIQKVLINYKVPLLSNSLHKRAFKKASGRLPTCEIK